jgi:hypothetical protein
MRVRGRGGARHAGAGVWLVLLATTSLVAAQAPRDSADADHAVSAGDEPPPQAEPAPPAPPLPLGDSLTGQAKRDYDAALLLHRSGDFASAERRFSTAYDLAGDVRLLWNAAACEQGLRHYSKAITLVRRYLASRSPLITEEAERNARAFLDAALPLTARLVVEPSESGSSVYVDDELIGTSPLDAEPRVDFGQHRLVVRHSRFKDGAETFTVTSSSDVHLRVQLEPLVRQGRLVVRAGPGDAIAVDGRFRALGTFDGTLPSGKHRLRVTSAGRIAFEQSPQIEENRTLSLDVKLTRAPVAFGLPNWVWLAGGAAVLAGAGTAVYLVARSPDPASASLPSGSAGRIQLPLR